MPKPKKKKAASSTVPLAILGAGVVALVVLMGVNIYRGEKAAANQMDRADSANCSPSPVRMSPPGVERIPCKTQNHVAEGQTVAYESDPPTSGAHYATWTNPGFYKEIPSKEKLVHSLEHGYVVIYYDQSKVTAEQLTAIEKVAQKYRGAWDGVVAVPRSDATYPVILTAWEHSLKLDSFDQARIDSFVDTFRGRGPENPVR